MKNERVANFMTSCAICISQPVSPIKTVCEHTFCKSCVEQWNNSYVQRTSKFPICPLCREYYCISTGGWTALSTCYIDEGNTIIEQPFVTEYFGNSVTVLHPIYGNSEDGTTTYIVKVNNRQSNKMSYIKTNNVKNSTFGSFPFEVIEAGWYSKK